MRLPFILLNVALVVVNGDSNCRKVFDETSLLNADSFAHDVSHGIHSLSVEDIDLFFGVDISKVEKNGIPTVNLNISDVEHPVMDDTPIAGYEKVWIKSNLNWKRSIKNIYIQHFRTKMYSKTSPSV